MSNTYTPKHQRTEEPPGPAAAPDDLAQSTESALDAYAKTQSAAARGAESRRAATQNKRKRPLIKYLLVALGVLALGAAGFFIFASFIAPALEANQQSEAHQEEQEGAPIESRVSLVAVGDNLPEIAIGHYGDACAGEMGDGLYDYRPIFAPIKPYIEAADLAYICFEIHAGGDAIGPRGWPSFNTTEAMIDAVEDAGFNLIGSATNHAYDWGHDALTNSALLWEQRNVLFAGTASSEEKAQEIKTIERNGIVFSLLSYTYGVNGYQEWEIAPYAVNYMHEDQIVSDITQARRHSDVVLVALHWGTEYYAGADERQLHLAQVIANAGADVILGSHPHVIGPLEWVEGTSGNKTLVAYSLGNFLSRHDLAEPMNELGGMLSCDFVKDEAGVRIENVQWTPVVNHSEEGAFAVYVLKDYSADLAARSRVFHTLEDPIGWMKAYTEEIIGPVAQIKT